MTGGLTRGPPYDRTTSGQLSDSLTISDLKPNIGLAWYFFIEMFDHFRAFFLVVFALHPLLYVAPFTFAYKYVCWLFPQLCSPSRDPPSMKNTDRGSSTTDSREPLFACTLIVGTIALLKSYPSFGDWAIWHALLGCFSELLPCACLPFSQLSASLRQLTHL